LRQAAPEAPAGLVEICERATAFEPAERFSTALEMRLALEPFLSRRGEGASTDLGTLLTSLFGGEREALQRRIEIEINSNSGPHALHAPPPPSGERSNASSFSFGPPSTATMLSLDGRPIESLRSSPRLTGGVKGRWRLITLATGVLTVAAALLRLRGGERATAPHVSTNQVILAPSASAAFDPAEGSKIEMSVRVKPVEAELYLDDQPLPGNPFRGSFERGGTHELRAEAPGYVTEKRSLSFSKDVTIDLALARRQLPVRGSPPGPPPRARGGPRTPASTSVKEPLELPATTPRRPVKPIDTESPY
jgi:serine/threonine-protein kinase